LDWPAATNVNAGLSGASTAGHAINANAPAIANGKSIRIASPLCSIERSVIVHLRGVLRRSHGVNKAIFGRKISAQNQARKKPGHTVARLHSYRQKYA